MKPHKSTNQIKTTTSYLKITSETAGQRIDNFLITKFKKMPKSHIYRLLRKGEVRVNKQRKPAHYKLLAGDIVRLPPIYLPQAEQLAPASKSTLALLAERILYEDDHFLIINKPSGMSVHLGSTVRIGIIEAMRQLYPQYPQLELAHRLDSETSGCLVLAKKKRILREIHNELREGRVKKIYWALTKGTWRKNELTVNFPLNKKYEDGRKHVVEVSGKGKSALTVFRVIKAFKQASLMEVQLFTGRTHQIRVHASHSGHAIAGDDRYGEADFNQYMRQLGLKRLFLHAKSIEFTLPSLSVHIRVEAPLDPTLAGMIKNLERG